MREPKSNFTKISYKIVSRLRQTDEFALDWGDGLIIHVLTASGNSDRRTL